MSLPSAIIFDILRDEIPLRADDCGCGDEALHGALIEQHNRVAEAFTLALLEAEG